MQLLYHYKIMQIKLIKSKRLTVLLGIAVVLIIIYGFFKQTYNSLQSGFRLEQAQNQLDQLKQDNLNLQAKLVQAGSLNFLEETFRNKLNLARPNETIVIISKEAIKRQIEQDKKVVEEIKLPNWQGWLRLFF